MPRKILLKPMSEASFRTYLPQHQKEFAAERARSDYLSKKEALLTTRKRFKKTLPDGRLSKGHHFFDVSDAKASETVGHVWLYLDKKNRIAWLYHITVHPWHRRRGYGLATMEAILGKAKSLGARVLWLNVFSHNKAALALYRASGLKPIAVHMNQLL